MNSRYKSKIIVMLILVSMLPLFATDIYLPSFTSLQSYFQTSMSAIQNTISVYLIGLSLGQLIYGPLSDRYGRKKTLLLGLIIYLCATLSCMFANSISWFLVSRVIQAIGACSGLVIGRAIIGDLFEGSEYIRMFATIYPIVGLSPAIAPVIGGYLTQNFGWRSNFLVIAIITLITIYQVFKFKESLLLRQNNQNIMVMIDKYLKVLKNGKFLYYCLMISSAYAAHFAFIAAAPFVLSRFNYSIKSTGYFYFLLSFTYLSANFICRKLINTRSLTYCLMIGKILFILGGLYLLGTALTNFSNPWFYIIPMSLITAANGFLIPLGAAGAIRSIENGMGFASGLMGSIQLLSASIAAFFTSIFTNGSALILASIILLIALMPILADVIINLKNRIYIFRS